MQHECDFLVQSVCERKICADEKGKSKCPVRQGAGENRRVSLKCGCVKGAPSARGPTLYIIPRVGVEQGHSLMTPKYFLRGIPSVCTKGSLVIHVHHHPQQILTVPPSITSLKVKWKRI